MREGINLTRLEATDIFLVLSVARLKLQGKAQTTAKIYWEKLEKILLPGVLPEIIKGGDPKK